MPRGSIDEQTELIRIYDLLTSKLGGYDVALAALAAAIEAIDVGGTVDLSTVTTDIARLSLKTDRRPRPDPYSTASTYTVQANATANTYGNRLKVISKGTYNFGDSPNWIQCEGLSVESMDSNAVYVLMAEISSDGITFTPVGAIRFVRTSVQTRSFIIPAPSRPFNCDAYDLYASLKSSPGSAVVTFSMSLARVVPVSEAIPQSTGVWPTG